MADTTKDPDPMAMMQAFASTFMKAMTEMNAKQSPAASIPAPAMSIQQGLGHTAQASSFENTRIAGHPNPTPSPRHNPQSRTPHPLPHHYEPIPIIKTSPTQSFQPLPSPPMIRSGYPPPPQQNARMRPVAQMHGLPPQPQPQHWRQMQMQHPYHPPQSPGGTSQNFRPRPSQQFGRSQQYTPRPPQGITKRSFSMQTPQSFRSGPTQPVQKPHQSHSSLQKTHLQPQSSQHTPPSRSNRSKSRHPEAKTTPVIPSIEPVPQTQLIQPWRHPSQTSLSQPTTAKPTSSPDINITRTSSLSSLSSLPSNVDEEEEPSLFVTKSPSVPSSRPRVQQRVEVEVQIPVSSDLAPVMKRQEYRPRVFFPGLMRSVDGVHETGTEAGLGVGKKRKGPVPSRPLSGPPPPKKKNKPTVVRLKEEQEDEFDSGGWYESIRGGRKVIVIDDSADDSEFENDNERREEGWNSNSNSSSIHAPVILGDEDEGEEDLDDDNDNNTHEEEDDDDEVGEEDDAESAKTREFAMELSDNSDDSDYQPQEPSRKRLRAIERDKRRRVEEEGGWMETEPGREEFEEVLGMASRAANSRLPNGFSKRMDNEMGEKRVVGSKEATPSIGGLAIPSVIWNRDKLHRENQRTRWQLDDKVKAFDRANSGIDTENENEDLVVDEEEEESVKRRVQQYIDENENFYAASDEEIAKAAVECKRLVEECEKGERAVKERIWREVETEARGIQNQQEKHYLRHEWPEHPLIRPYISARLSYLPVEITKICTLASLTRAIHACTAQPPIPVRTLSHSCIIKDTTGETLVVKINTGLEETFSHTPLYAEKGPLNTHILTAMNRLESHGVHPPPPRNTDARHSNSRYTLAKEYWASKGMPCGVFYFACWRPLGHFRAHFSKTAGSYGHSLSKDILGEHGWDFGVRVRYLADMAVIHQAISLWFEAIDRPRYASYRSLVDKLSEADTGLDAVRFTTNQSFIALATLRNMQARNHKDKTNVTDGWAGMTCVGSFTGGEICLPDLDLNLTFLPGDVIFFRSSLLQHFVRRFVGSRSSLIFFTQTDPKQPLVQNARFSEMGSKEWEVISSRRKADLEDEASRKEKMKEFEDLEPYPTEEKDLTPWKLKMARRRKVRFVGFARKEVESGKGGVTEEDVKRLEEMEVARFYELNLVELSRWKRGFYPFASMKDDDGKRVRKRKR